MYCRKCYADLGECADVKCPKCGLHFDPQVPGTYLRRPFPRGRWIVLHLLLTTALGFAAAFVVAFHQAASRSGH